MRTPIVICYHHINTVPRPDHYFFGHCSTFEMFHREMRYLRQQYVAISVPEMADRLERGAGFPRACIIVTFDDGHRSNLDAARLLHELSIPACFFVTSETIDSSFVPPNLRFAHIVTTRSVSKVELDGHVYDLTRVLPRRRWLSRVRKELRALPPGPRAERLDAVATLLGSAPLPADDPDYGFLSSDDLREMRGLGMTIGSHGATHDNMARCTEAELHDEMGKSKQRIEAMLEAPVEFFAYPDGHFNRRARGVARHYYRLAFTAGLRGSARDGWAYPRTGVDGAALTRCLSWWYPWRARLFRIAKRVLSAT